MMNSRPMSCAPLALVPPGRGAGSGRASGSAAGRSGWTRRRRTGAPRGCRRGRSASAACARSQAADGLDVEGVLVADRPGAGDRRRRHARRASSLAACVAHHLRRTPAGRPTSGSRPARAGSSGTITSSPASMPASTAAAMSSAVIGERSTSPVTISPTAASLPCIESIRLVRKYDGHTALAPDAVSRRARGRRSR